MIKEIRVVTSHFLRTQLASYQIDLAMLVGTSQDPKEVHIHLCDYGLAWVASPRLKLHGRPITIPELDGYPAITFPAASQPYRAVQDAPVTGGIKQTASQSGGEKGGR